MSETETLPVEKREKTGTAESRRLRRSGRIPAVLYGHGEANQHLSMSDRDVQTILRHHSKTVQLTGGIEDTALISDVHYDPLGIDVLHMDLIRVNLKEKVTVTVPIHTRGEAAGVAAGGILLQSLHEIEIECPAGNIPDHIDIDVSKLQLGEHLCVSDLTMPEESTLITEGEISIVRVEEPKAPEEPEETDAAIAGEPEIIAKGGGDEEDAEKSDD